MFRNKSVNVHSFAMVPNNEIPRSQFRMQHAHKTTFDAGWLIPVYVDEMVPGDRFNMRMTAFCRLATPLVPVMDNLHLESFFFFTPTRILQDNWVKLQGEQDNPDDPVDYGVPQILSPTGGFPPLSVYDYMGLTTSDQYSPVGSTGYAAYPLRAHNKIFNDWFRDQNLQDSLPENTGDTADDWEDYSLFRRNKRHDYFTSGLPWTQKGPPVTIGLAGTAPIYGLGEAGYPTAISVMDGQPAGTTSRTLQITSGAASINLSSNASSTGSLTFTENLQPLEADLTDATGILINEFRLAMQMQVALERDARGGTRYVEAIRARFGVTPPDFRLQRPEYIGGGRTMVTISAVPQTSATSAEGTDTPQGNLAATGTALAAGHGFTYSATEHGYVLGYINVRADLNYQQGVRRLWKRGTRWDFLEPAFVNIGEQPIFNYEIYEVGDGADALVFAYQERYAEYRYHPSLITAKMRSADPTSVDIWHYAQEFANRPLLNDEFIVDRTDEVLRRALAVHEEADGQQFLCDMFFDNTAARPLPMYGVPGLGGRF